MSGLINRQSLAEIPGAEILDDQDIKRIEEIARKEIGIAIRVTRWAAENSHRLRINRPMSKREPTATWRRDRGMYMTEEEIFSE